MRICEKNIVSAIREGRNYSDNNNCVNVRNGVYSVYLFGNLIARGYVGEMPSRFCFCGWLSHTTLSRLRALGVNIERKRDDYYVFGKAVEDTYRVFDRNGDTVESMTLAPR